MRQLLISIAFALFVGTAGVLGAQTPEVPANVRRVAGCYRLTLGPWARFPTADRRISPDERPPTQFALEPALLDTGRLIARVPPPNRRYRVTPARLAAGDWSVARWLLSERDSVGVIWPIGAVGGNVAVLLGGRGDTLVGRATRADTWPERGRADPEAPARAVRVPCAGPRAR